MQQERARMRQAFQKESSASLQGTECTDKPALLLFGIWFFHTRVALYSLFWISNIGNLLLRWGRHCKDFCSILWNIENSMLNCFFEKTQVFLRFLASMIFVFYWVIVHTTKSIRHCLLISILHSLIFGLGGPSFKIL